ncbi:MAG: HDOD domain-containing protein [Syntrophobacteraceae bacterium]
MLEKTATKGRIPQSFFTDLADKDRITLFNTGQIRSIAAKELLFKQGNPDRTLYYVLGGTLIAECREADPSGFRFRPGDLIGEVSLSGNNGRISSVAAEEPSAVLSLDPAAFRTLSYVTQSAILKRLHDTALSRAVGLEKQVERARLQGTSLTRHLKKARKPLGKYEQSEIISNIVKSIPRLPLHITHLIDLLASERASAKDVADLAKQDPSLVVDILKAINSSRYSLQKEISDVSYAITYMGFNEVYQIAVSRGLMKSIPDSEAFRDIYRHSLFLSYIAYELCQFYDKNRAPLLSTRSPCCTISVKPSFSCWKSKIRSGRFS